MERLRSLFPHSLAVLRLQADTDLTHQAKLSFPYLFSNLPGTRGEGQY